DGNGGWGGNFPIIFAPCEAVDPEALKWLLDHGADPNRGNRNWANTALDYLICSYARSSQLPACIDLILEAGGKTKYDVPGVLDLLRGRIDRLAEQFDADPDLVNRRFPELDCGQTGDRPLLLRASTPLHVAAQYGRLEAAR